MKKLLTLLLAVLLLAGCAGNKPGTFEAGRYLSAEWETVRGQSGRGALSAYSP